MPLATHIDLDLFQRVTKNDGNSLEIREVLEHLAECDRCSRIVSMMKSESVILGMAALLWSEEDSRYRSIQRKIMGSPSLEDNPKIRSYDPPTRPARSEPKRIQDEEAERKWVTLPDLSLEEVPAVCQELTYSKNVYDNARYLEPVRKPEQRVQRLTPQSPPRSVPRREVMEEVATVAQHPDMGKSTQEFLRFLGPPIHPHDLGQLAQYRVLRVLGTGGLGIVFQGEDTQLKRMVAIKTLKPGSHDHDIARERFLREARAVAALDHENIVSVHQVGEWHGEPFMVMPMLQGESLDACLEREKKLPVLDVMRIAKEAAKGLSVAHDRGLFHRDIKPANIWIEAGTKRVKILDFGLARAASEDVQLTKTGTVVGTPAFMSPEQAKGGRVDHRTDLYSLGAMMYLMLTGKPPLEAPDTMAMLLALQYDQPTPLATLAPLTPPPLIGLVNRLLAKLPEGRPEHASNVVTIIETIEQKLPQVIARLEQVQSSQKEGNFIYIAIMLLFSFGVSSLWWGPPAYKYVMGLIKDDSSKPGSKTK